MWRSPVQPELGWGRSIAAVLCGLLLPAIPAAGLLWYLQMDVQGVMATSNAGLRFVWFVAACLMASPLLAWLAVPVATPLVRIAARRGWAGPASMMGLGLIVGLPLVHVFLNGDLTKEAPKMIPYLATALCVQALSGWLVLRLGQFDAQARNTRSVT